MSYRGAELSKHGAEPTRLDGPAPILGSDEYFCLRFLSTCSLILDFKMSKNLFPPSCCRPEAEQADLC